MYGCRNTQSCGESWVYLGIFSAAIGRVAAVTVSAGAERDVNNPARCADDTAAGLPGPLMQ